MTLNLLVWAGGLLALAVAGTLVRLSRQRSTKEITTEQLSGDWLAQARAKEEQQW
jgi:hypothetical protein